ncbi:Acetyl esterase/lipase [Micromonospora pattaloongensis]|uniref:Acetyl esterase/lipase n=1 Tax=Micromonospora pattaloongensis TaxID=405436 RepID=A0A1H3NJ99_9ACTN|nr:alpha/beta hydrolase [Micromonospora pattaloongensis]SDY89007.1 Acetyl esterase/lipase [Micromonospora pattaloongensis]
MTATDPRAVLTRPAPPPDLTVRYGPLADHVADVRRPRTVTGPAPLVLVVHGGFWRAAYDRQHTGPLCDDLAGRGFAVAAIEYRRVGRDGGGWPDIFDDVALAVDRVPGLVAEALGDRVRADRVVLLGHSAGGHLAVWAAARHRLPATAPWRTPAPSPAVRGVVSLAGVLDLAAASAQRLGDAATDELLGGDPAAVPDRYAAADPAALLPVGVPVTLVHGRDDLQVPWEISERYAEAARRAGDDVSVRLLDGIEHFGVIDPLSPAWPSVLDALRRLAFG